jgi:hypothetical protein
MKYAVTEQGIKFSDHVKLPCESFFGAHGFPPQVQAVPLLQTAASEGIWTCPLWRQALLSIFPVLHNVAIAISAIAMADMVTSGCAGAPEIPSTTMIQGDLIKNWSITWPRFRTNDFVMAIGAARLMEEAGAGQSSPA